MTVRELLRRLERVSKTHTGWMARCPAHEDKDPSLSISLGEDGRLLVHCFAGCSNEQIVQVMGLTMAALTLP